MRRLIGSGLAVACLVVVALGAAACGGAGGASSRERVQSARTSPFSSPRTSTFTTTTAAPAPTEPQTIPRHGTGVATSLTISAAPSGRPRYDAVQANARAGRVTIVFVNRSSVAHDLRVQGPAGDELGGTPAITGSTATVTARLSVGTYTFYCSVDGHRRAGMQGRLTVT